MLINSLMDEEKNKNQNIDLDNTKESADKEEKTSENQGQINNLNLEEINNNLSNLFSNIDQQVLNLKLKEMQLASHGQLTGKKQKQKKMALRKSIARLKGMKTNPSSMLKFLQESYNYQLFEKMQKELLAAEVENNITNANDTNTENTENNVKEENATKK